MSTALARILSEPSGDFLSCSPFDSKVLFLLFILSLTVSAQWNAQATEPGATSLSTYASIPVPNFSIGATLPNIVPADGTSPASSTIIVSPMDNFAGTVTLSDLPLPADLTCKAIEPATITISGMANLSCSSIAAGTYKVTIIGTSVGIRHSATTTFTFTSSTYPDFTISATTPVSMTVGTTATSIATVTSTGGFESQVDLTTTVYPNNGLSVSLSPPSLLTGSGTSTITFSSSTPGDYTVTITGTSELLSHKTTVVVDVSLAGTPDFGISASADSINIEIGTSGTTNVTITPINGFTGSIALSLSARAGVSCSLSPNSIQTSGASTLTCSSSTAGDHAVTITATGGASSHTITVTVHFTELSPAAPVPSTILGLGPPFFYGIVGVISIILGAGTVVVVRRLRGSRP